MERLQKLYDSEINFNISCYWDAGFSWVLGDLMNGVCEEGSEYKLEDAVNKICEAAVKHFPESDFARNYEVL